MDDNTRFPPMVDLSRSTELQWKPKGQQPETVPVKGGKSTSTGWAKEYPAPPAELSPYPGNKEE